MAETYIQANTDGSGKKIRTYDRTISAQVVHEEVNQLGEGYLPTYIVQGGASAATVGDDLIQLMAGSSLNVRVIRIHLEQAANASAAGAAVMEVARVTSAGTGGTAVTPTKYDNGDSAAGATGMSGVPNATKGTIGTIFWTREIQPMLSGGSGTTTNPQWEWTRSVGGKPIIIPAGTSNGLVIRNLIAKAGLTCYVEIEFTETAWL